MIVNTPNEFATWRWCAGCGECWAAHNDRSGGCLCDVGHLMRFPDPAQVEAAWRLGGDAAITPIEQELYRQRLQRRRERIKRRERARGH